MEVDGDPYLHPALLTGLKSEQKLDKLRGVIRRLYCDEKHSLKEIVDIIEAEYGFKAV
jgi:hypothetical protein